MSGTLRPPEHYIHGLVEPEAIVPARVAAWLDRTVGFDQLRRRAVGDPVVLNVLTALSVLAANHATAGTGRGHRQGPGATAASAVMTTTQAATALRMTDRGVRWAIAEGRLVATKNAAGRWRIARCDLQHFDAARAA